MLGRSAGILVAVIDMTNGAFLLAALAPRLGGSR
jgi:hypothetical protein